VSKNAHRIVHVPRIAEVVAGDLRRRIVTGELTEGEALPLEADLVAQYGVSRPTLREAIRILESQSLIAVRRGSRTGALVQQPDIRVAALHAAIRMQIDGTTLADVFGARIEIGVSAVRMLASSHDAAAVARLRELHAIELRLAHDADGYPVAVSHFHAAVVELAGNQSLALVRHILEEIVLAHERSVPNPEGCWNQFMGDHDQDDHTEIIRVIEAGDSDGAEALWRPHLVRSAARVLDKLGPDAVVNILGRDGMGA
jgi:DNA-binding FadR family transcriptional regulator